MQTSSVAVGTPTGVQFAAVNQSPLGGPLHVFVGAPQAAADAVPTAPARASSSPRMVAPNRYARRVVGRAVIERSLLRVVPQSRRRPLGGRQRTVRTARQSIATAAYSYSPSIRSTNVVRSASL